MPVHGSASGQELYFVDVYSISGKKLQKEIWSKLRSQQEVSELMPYLVHVHTVLLTYTTTATLFHSNNIIAQEAPLLIHFLTQIH